MIYVEIEEHAVDVLSEFAKICGEYADFREALIEAYALSDNPSEQDALVQLAAQMDQSLAVAKRELPRELTGVQAEWAELQRSTAAMQQEIAAAEDAIAAAADAPPEAAPEPVWVAPAPTWTEASLDADLRTYRTELLELLTGKKTAEKASPENFREIWQDWSKHGDK